MKREVDLKAQYLSKQTDSHDFFLYSTVRWFMLTNRMIIQPQQPLFKELLNLEKKNA